MNLTIDILNNEQISLLDNILKESKNIIICAHKSPDGDALGSCIGFANFIEKTYNKTANIVVPDAFPDFLKWLPDNEKILRYDKRQEYVDKLLQSADAIFCLDFNESSRIEEMQQSLDASPAKKIMIDHHLNPSMETVLTISHPEMSSTSELIFRIVWQMGFFEQQDSHHFAIPIYCGMMTDTGGFTYNSNNPEIYFIICQLLTKHIDKDKIYRNVFNNYSSWAIRLRGYILCQKLNVFEDRHASYFAITKEEMKDYHFIKGDAEGLVNEPLRIKGLKMSISLREDDRKENKVWISIRSIDEVRSDLIASEFFNGGGHEHAAGGKLDCSISEAEEIAKLAISSLNQ